MQVKIEKSWREVLASEFSGEYFKKLADFVKEEYLSNKIFPPLKLIFNAFELCSFDNVKVVILGQDPYHGTGQAHGLCFSVPEKIRIPPSLKNIYKEIVDDIGGDIPSYGNLEFWAKQGVLLLNATLTVRANSAGSHQGNGWEIFTDAVIKEISERKENVVFILWGNYARKKKDLIDETKHLILEAPHPSPFSAYTGFFGCKHFSKTNDFLKKSGKEPIKWLP
ncbi:MAG: uracil-DNA glycosylase [Parcubacteria group bacterium CG11_big_fil_rev_8_21_14_0_20_39_22]|nr:MAG: uracil-DNA glycosylase [Parcubacteria group bacterium CG11_big_fil_rev_8_21_14_0_20_39_22]